MTKFIRTYLLIDHNEFLKYSNRSHAGPIKIYCQLRARRALLQIKDVSVENQKGTFADQRCSVENQKGAFADQRCSVENQKGAIAIDFVQR